MKQPTGCLLTQPAGHVVLTDFGCAKEWREETQGCRGGAGWAGRFHLGSGAY
jgi:hypothetical protein